MPATAVGCGGEGYKCLPRHREDAAAGNSEECKADELPVVLTIGETPRCSWILSPAVSRLAMLPIYMYSFRHKSSFPAKVPRRSVS